MEYNVIDAIRRLEDENKKLKQVIEDLTESFEIQEEKPRACERCKFYMQHYIKSGKQYAKTNSGHCVQGRIKARKPGDTCKFFEFGTHSQEMVNLIGGKK